MAAPVHDQQHRAAFLDADFIWDKAMKQRRGGLRMEEPELDDRVVGCLGRGIRDAADGQGESR